MEKSRLFGCLCAVLYSIISMSANAELHGRLPLTPGGTDYQAAYDDVLDVTWLTDAGLSGWNTWANQLAWVDGLNNSNYLGFSHWRLASMDVNGDTAVVDCSGVTELACRDNELGYMYYQNLGGTWGGAIIGDQTVDGVLLTDIQTAYWSGTASATDPAGAWFFSFNAGGAQGDITNGLAWFSWAVADGDVESPTLIDNGYSTIDSDTGLEWLDLTLTKGVAAQDVLDGFGGYIYDGWSFATVEQVCGLFGALGDDTTNCTTGALAVPMNPANAEMLVNLLGSTVAPGRGAYGMFDNLGGDPNSFGIGCINDTATSCTWGGASSWLTLIEWAGGYPTVGSFLVRDYVEPPPPTALIDNGYTTIDPSSGLEWLDLTFTRGISAQDVLAGFGGYIYDDWTFATVEQVCGLIAALGDNSTGCSTGAMARQMIPTNAETLVNLLGDTAATGRGTYGMFDNLGGDPDSFGIGCINDTATSCTWGGASSWLTVIEWASGYQTVGSFLVRDYIEPPPTTTLIDNGDTTIDTASGLEWLDLRFTQGVSAQQVLDGFGNFIEVGWAFATAEQVCGLFGALGDDTTDCPTGAVARQMNPTKSETLVNLLGNTAATGRGAYGMFDNLGGFPGNFGLGCINDTATSCTLGGASSWLTQVEWAGGYETVSSFLVRDYIEPAPTIIMTYSSRALFEADNPGFVIEDFEEANIAAATDVSIPGPLDATSNDGVFAPGDIAAALVINEYPDSTPGELVVYGDGSTNENEISLPGLSSTQISFSDCALELHLMFAAGVQSVGFDIYNIEPNLEIVARVYSGATLLDTITVRGSGTGTSFFLGVASDEVITRVSLAPSDALYFTVDNVTFTSTAQGEVKDIAINGGFETGDFIGWAQFPQGGLQTIVSPGNASAFAAQLTVPTRTQSDPRVDNVITNANLGAGLLTPGAPVTVAWDMRGSLEGAGAFVFVEFFSQLAGEGVSKAEIYMNGPIVPTDDWQSFVWNTTLGPDVGGGVELKLSARCEPVEGCGVDSYFDNITITTEVANSQATSP